MGPLDLDFRSTRPASPLGWALFLAGAAALAGLLAVHLGWREEARAIGAALPALEARLPGQAPAPPRDEAALAAARKALEKSRLPWGSLFAALESADNRDVAVLAVLPDGPRGQVKIEAEARNLAAMLAYQRRLEEAGGLAQVTLADHEAGGDPMGAPVRFRLSAAWGEAHGRP